MIKSTYRAALVLGVVAAVAAIVALVGVVQLLVSSFTWGRLFTLASVLGWGVLSAALLVGSRVAVVVNEAGVRRPFRGGWGLSWNEIESVRVTPSEVVIEPSSDALKRQSIRSAASSSRVFTLGAHRRGLIVLPRPQLGADALAVLREHGADVAATDSGLR